MRRPTPEFEEFVRDVRFDIWAAGREPLAVDMAFLYACYREGLSVRSTAKIEVSLQRRKAERESS